METFVHKFTGYVFNTCTKSLYKCFLKSTAHLINKCQSTVLLFPEQLTLFSKHGYEMMLSKYLSYTYHGSVVARMHNNYVMGGVSEWNI